MPSQPQRKAIHTQKSPSLNEKYRRIFGEKKNQKKIRKKVKTERATGLGRRRRKDFFFFKVYLNNSPKIQDRRKPSDIPASLWGVESRAAIQASMLFFLPQIFF